MGQYPVLGHNECGNGWDRGSLTIKTKNLKGLNSFIINVCGVSLFSFPVNSLNIKFCFFLAFSSKVFIFFINFPHPIPGTGELYQSREVPYRDN